MPSDSRHVVESVLKPSQPNSHLIDKILVVNGCLVGHAPSRVDEVELTFLD